MKLISWQLTASSWQSTATKLISWQPGIDKVTANHVSLDVYLPTNMNWSCELIDELILCLLRVDSRELIGWQCLCLLRVDSRELIGWQPTVGAWMDCHACCMTLYLFAHVQDAQRCAVKRSEDPTGRFKAPCSSTTFACQLTCQFETQMIYSNNTWTTTKHEKDIQNNMQNKPARSEIRVVATPPRSICNSSRRRALQRCNSSCRRATPDQSMLHSSMTPLSPLSTRTISASWESWSPFISAMSSSHVT